MLRSGAPTVWWPVGATAAGRLFAACLLGDLPRTRGGAGEGGADEVACLGGVMMVSSASFARFFELQRMAKAGMPVWRQFLGKDSDAATLKRVLVLPPPDDVACVDPCSSWGFRVNRLVSEYKSLQITSAYLSTMGGGWFMTRKVGNAQRMARRQLLVAVRLGDPAMVLACRIHLVYSQIQLGQFARARATLAEQMRVVRDELRGDPKLVSLVQSAMHHNERAAALVREKGLAPVLIGQADDTSRRGAKSNLEDEFYRYRVVIEQDGPSRYGSADTGWPGRPGEGEGDFFILEKEV